MYVVVNTFEKDEKKDEIKYTLIKGEHLPGYLEEEGIDSLSYSKGNKHVEIFLFETEKEAEACMGSK